MKLLCNAIIVLSAASICFLDSLAAESCQFHELSRTGSLEQVQAAIAEGLDVNEADDDGYTALMFATQSQNARCVVTELLKAGAEVNARTKQGTTALIYAAGEEDLDVVTMLLKAGADVNVNPFCMCNALMIAADENEKTDVIQALLNAGARVNDKHSGSGETALMMASAHNTNLAITATLLNGGADVNATDNLGSTALIDAAYKNDNQEVPMALLEAGADVNAQNRLGGTALLGAVQNSRTNLIIALLKAGANVDEQVHDRAVKNPHLAGTSVLEDLGRQSGQIPVNNSDQAVVRSSDETRTQQELRPWTLLRPLPAFIIVAILVAIFVMLRYRSTTT